VKAYLYDPDGSIVATQEVSDTDPPKHIDRGGERYVWAGSSARIHDDGVEQVGWDYARNDGDEHA
jgi:hypothetical protein